MPNSALQLNDNKEYIVNAESIYDTLLHYSGENTNAYIDNNTVSLIEVLQIDCDKYLAKFKDIENARGICHLINKMEVNKHLIRVEMLENFKNFSDIDEFNTSKNNTENSSDNTSSNDISDDSSNDISDDKISDDKISDYGVGSFSNKYTLLLPTYLKFIYVKGYAIVKYLYSFFITKKM